MAEPPRTPAVLTVDLAGPAATEALAADIAGTLRTGDVVALTGDLGAGKTVFARALIHALGRMAGIGFGDVPSPTFTLVQLYELPGAVVYHFDLYRLQNADEAYEIGIEDAFAEGISVIEWAERIEDILPPGTIHVHIEFGGAETARTAHVSGWTRAAA